MKFKLGSYYTRDDIWKEYHPNEGERPSGGNWVGGYVTEGNDLIAFLNIGVPGTTGHDFDNYYDEEKKQIIWFGKPGTNSSQPLMNKIINKELNLNFFARWDNTAPFKYLGLGEVDTYKDGIEMPDGRKTIKYNINIQNILETIGEELPSSDVIEDEIKIFTLEKQLEDFIVENWSNTIFGREYDIYRDENENFGKQYPVDTGRIDILAKNRDSGDFLVLELKKGRTSDETLGQIQRYMGYVKHEIAKDEEGVKGVIIGLRDDLKLKRALSVSPNVKFYRYEINFKLIEGGEI